MSGKIEYSEETEQRQREKHFCIWMEGFLTANDGKEISSEKVKEIQGVFDRIVSYPTYIVSSNFNVDDIPAFMKPSVGK